MKASFIWGMRALLIGAMVFGLPACGKSDSGFIGAFQRSARAAATSTDHVITTSAATDFQWDKLFIFGPYTPVQNIHSQLGFKWADAKRTRIDSSDTFYLLVFVKNGDVIRHFKFPRTIGDFQALETGNVFSPTDDAFEVKSVDAGETARLNLFPRRKEKVN